MSTAATRLYRASVIWLATLATLGWSGCFDPQIRDGELACSTGLCPPGLECAADGFCYRTPPNPMDPSDAGPNPSDGGPNPIAFPIVDSFADTDKLTDLSQLIAWGGNPIGTSAFQLGTHDDRQAISLLQNGTIDATDHSSLSDPTALRGFSSIDYVFAEPVTRASSTLTIEFDIAWTAGTSNGESGKLHFIVLHEYPAAGVQPDQDRNLTGNPYGRPAYSLILRNAPSGNGGGRPFLFYGGGDDDETDDNGRLNIFENMWWLPGFASPPGPGQVGVDEQYPTGSWLLAPEAVGSLQYQRFRFAIGPDAMQLFRDDALIIDFELPAASSAPLYRYFEPLRALRIYWRGVEQAYLANLRIDRISE